MTGREAAEMSEQQHYEQFEPDWPFTEDPQPLSDKTLAEQTRELLEAYDCAD